MSDERDAATRQLCTFIVNGQQYGIDVNYVQEVIRQQDMTPVPLAPPAVQGLINLRGHIVTAVDLRRQLGFPPRDPSAPLGNVVVRNTGGVVSLLVDEIGDVIDVDVAAIEEPPTTMHKDARHMIAGACKLQGNLLVLLDATRAAG